MKPLFIIILLLSTFTLSAQCPDYQSEIQNVENYISSLNRNFKKVMKVDSLEKAQELIDKSVIQLDNSIKSITLAKEYATECNCEIGATTATNLYNAIFDYKNLSQKIADSGSIEELKKAMKKNLTIGETVLDEITEASSLCLEE
jgi:hypothetical protein